MRTAGTTFDDHMLYTIFIDALPAKYEVEARNLASRDSIGHHDIIKAYDNGITDFLEAGRRGPMLAMPAMLICRRRRWWPQKRGRRRCRRRRWRPRKRKGGRRGRQGRGGESTNEDGGGSAAAAGGDSSSAKAADGGTSEVRCHKCGKKDHWTIDCTEELCSKDHGRENCYCLPHVER